jgi:excisionase family DNA binding protein
VGEDRDTAQDRVTIQEAAHRLGVKEDAIRKRIQRGSMRHEKADDGRVYVWVDKTQDTDRSSQDAYQDTIQDDRLEDLREQIAYLRRQLAEERDARRRADMILAQLSQANSEQARTIRAIEAPQNTSEASEPGEEQQGRDLRAPARCPRPAGDHTTAVVAESVRRIGGTCTTIRLPRTPRGY